MAGLHLVVVELEDATRVHQDTTGLGRLGVPLGVLGVEGDLVDGLAIRVREGLETLEDLVDLLRALDVERDQLLIGPIVEGLDGTDEVIGTSRLVLLRQEVGQRTGLDGPPDGHPVTTLDADGDGRLARLGHRGGRWVDDGGRWFDGGSHRGPRHAGRDTSNQVVGDGGHDVGNPETTESLAVHHRKEGLHRRLSIPWDDVPARLGNVGAPLTKVSQHLLFPTLDQAHHSFRPGVRRVAYHTQAGLARVKPDRGGFVRRPSRGRRGSHFILAKPGRGW